MTIQFYCPNCGALIAFDRKHIGEQAHCTTCDQHFIIPSKDFEKPRKVKLQPEKPEPIIGFYRSALLDSWKLFFDRENTTSLVFVAAVVSFRFFLVEFCCLGSLIHFVLWGWLFGFYLNIIYETAYDIDKLSEIYLGTSITFLWYMVKPLVVFLFTMAIVQLPFIITLAILDRKGITYEELWIGQTNLHLLLRILFMTGLFIFPMAILTTAVSKDIMLLRPDYLIKPILKALVPYLVVAALVIATGIAEMQTANYFFSPDISLVQNINRLGLNLAVQLIAIIAMRSIGLFYRHYACYCAW